MRTLVVVITIIGLAMLNSCDNNNKSSPLPTAKVYVANEAEGSVSVIDLQDSLKTTSIDLGDSAGNIFLPHNVQTAPRWEICLGDR